MIGLRTSCTLAGWLCIATTALAQDDRPALIVLISIDQFPNDYLHRYRHNFAGDGLFKRLLDDAAYFANCHHRHAFTFTGPGHACMMTGADPEQHGIIGNSWFDRATGKSLNCVGDSKAPLVGLQKKEGGVSPRNLLAPTVGDLLKLAGGGRSKVFGIALKDRAAVLMTGHAADAAFWLDDGQWVTSEYYRKDLPGYLRIINEGGMARQYAGKEWKLMLAADKYTLHNDDDAKWEKPPNKEFSRAFPHKLIEPKNKASEKKYFDQFDITPFANEFVLKAATRVLIDEKLGQDDDPDILAVGLSSNDLCGHAFGPYSLEVEDMTYRTDKMLGDFVRDVEKHMRGEEDKKDAKKKSKDKGKDKKGDEDEDEPEEEEKKPKPKPPEPEDEDKDKKKKQSDRTWVLVLTSDHGIAPSPEFAAHRRLMGKRDPLGDARNRIEAALKRQFGVPRDNKGYVQEFDGTQTYLRRSAFKPDGEDYRLAQLIARDILISRPPVIKAMTREQLISGGSGELADMLRRSFFPGRSGDVLYVLAPYQMQIDKKTNTTHGSPWQHDTHVPLFLMGPGFKPGRYDRKASPAAIAPTLSRLLNMTPPPACVEEALAEALTAP